MIVATDVTAGNTGDAAAAAGLLAPDLPAETGETGEPLMVYGDSAYGTGVLLDTFEQAGVITRCKTQPPRAPGGRFPKSEFHVDLDAGTVRCPASHTARLRPIKNGQIARFGKLCAGCPLAGRCTSSRSGRTIQRCTRPISPASSPSSRHTSSQPAGSPDARRRA